jgi:hypothetical protein
MANNFESNFTRKLAAGVLKSFENKRVLSKNVDTQRLSGQFDPNSGENVDFRRPTDYISQRTSDGDISATTASSIITGKATGTVQDYITVEVDYFEADEALKMGDTQRFFDNMGQRVVTDLEVDFASFMMKNSGLLAGDGSTAVTTWDHVAEAGAVLSSTGVPMDDMWVYAVNPYTQRKLASDQRSLGGETGAMTSNQRAVITDNFAGMRVMTANALASYTSDAGADRAGTLSANPDVTYATAKDSMTQTLAVAGFQANLPVKAGEVIQIAGRNRLNLNTRQAIVDDTGSNVLFTATVTADVTLSGTGTGNIVVTGPALFEAAGQYNTVDSAPVSGDVVTLLGSASELHQPNLFWHRQAFSIGSVPIKKLNSTDTIATTKDGLQMRVSKGTSFRENKQIVRIDFRPAYAVLNPFFAGHGYGV